MANYLDNNVKYVAGVGDTRAKLLEKELGILSIGDLLSHYPFRYNQYSQNPFLTPFTTIL